MKRSPSVTVRVFGTTLAAFALVACIRRTPSSAPSSGASATASARAGADAGAPLDAKATDAALQEAYDILAKQPTGPETAAAFRRVLGGAPTQAVSGNGLTGALSEDGEVVVVQLAGHPLSTYVAEAKTGKLLGRWLGGGVVADATGQPTGPRFLDRTHLVVFQERVAGSVELATLVVRDARLGADALRSNVAKGCAPAATGDRLAWVVRESDGTDQVHVWDAKTRTEIDRFAAPAPPRQDGCLRMPTASLVGVAWGGGEKPRAFLLRDTTLHKDVLQIAGGGSGPLTQTSPDERNIAIGTTPSQGPDPTPPSKKLHLVDAKTGGTIATADACGSAGSLAFDSRGQLLAVGAITEICVFEVPSLKLVRRTRPLRPPFPRVPGTVPPTISSVRFFGDAALLASSQDGLYALYKMPAGTLEFKGEHGHWGGVEGAGTAHAFASSDEGDGAFLSRHVRVSSDLRVTEDAFGRTETGKVAAEAWRVATPDPLRSALDRVAAQSCEARGELYPRQVCPNLSRPR